MPLKENLVLSFPKRSGHATPCRTTGKILGVARQEQEGKVLSKDTFGVSIGLAE